MGLIQELFSEKQSINTVNKTTSLPLSHFYIPKLHKTPHINQLIIFPKNISQTFKLGNTWWLMGA